jgi:serine/threonine protein kinase
LWWFTAVCAPHALPRDFPRAVHVQAADELFDEAAVMAQVRFHRNLVSLIGVVTTGTPLYLVLSICDEGSLKSMLEEQLKKKTPVPRGRYHVPTHAWYHACH